MENKEVEFYLNEKDEIFKLFIGRKIINSNFNFIGQKNNLILIDWRPTFENNNNESNLL